MQVNTDFLSLNERNIMMTLQSKHNLIDLIVYAALIKSKYDKI